MIPYIDSTSIVHIETGMIKSVIEGDLGLYELLIWNQKNEYQLTTPSGEVEKHPIDKFFEHKSRYSKIERGLSQWIFMVFSAIEEQERNRIYGFTQKDLVIDNRRYIVEYCAHTKDIRLTIAGYVIVSKRADFTTRHEELTHMENGQVAEKVVDVIYDTLKAIGKADIEPTELLFPIEFSNLGAYKIGGNSYHIEYDTNSDMVLFMTESKTIKTQLEYLDTKMPELESLHSGELQRELLIFIEQCDKEFNV